MSVRALLLLLLFGAALAAAETPPSPPSPPSPLQLAGCDALVRPPALFRAWIQREVASDDFASGPFTLQISLEQGQRLLAADDIPLMRLGQLREGVRVALAVGELDPFAADAPAILRVTLANPARTRIERLAREIPTPRALARELERLTAGLRQRAEPDPLPWLWAEQAAELANGGANAADCRTVTDLVAMLRGWTAGKRPQPGPTIAYRDTIDGSVQPERHYAPSGAVRATAWLFRSLERTPTKSGWPAASASWLSAAAAAGCAVVDCYPAGDLRWSGAALLRAEARLAQTQGPVLLVGSGDGALAAARLAALHPERVAALRLIAPCFQNQGLPPAPAGLTVSLSDGDQAARAWAGDPAPAPAPDEAACWTLPAAAPSRAAPASRAKTIPALASPLAAYAGAPFVVVVGVGEHLAAQEDDRRLGQAFAAAWAAHAHGLPRLIEDDGYVERDWRGFNLVLIGNARSNRVLRDIARHHALPVTWDSRSLTVAAGDHAGTWMRSERRPVAFSLPRPDDAERVVVVLDGAPSWRGGEGLPLAQLPDPCIGEPAPPQAPGARDAATMMTRP